MQLLNKLTRYSSAVRKKKKKKKKIEKQYNLELSFLNSLYEKKKKKWRKYVVYQWVKRRTKKEKIIRYTFVSTN